MNIAVFGLGYVGVVNIACLSKLGHKVYGCDVKPHKVELINKGKSTILEPEVEGLIAEGIAKDTISCSTEADFCVERTELALICVGTPSDAQGNVNLNYIVNTCNEIARAAKKSDKSYTIVLRSTIPPGTIENVVMPELVGILGDKMDKINVVFLPEFLREGSAVKDFFHGARIVVGVNNKKKGESEIRKIFEFSDKVPLVFTNYKTAEFVKYVDNAYHATKVAFANEVYAIGSELDVDVKQANDIFLMDTILNISPRYLKPGPPFGGSCLPKDSRAIVCLGQKANMEIPFFKGMIASNNAQQKRLLLKVLALNGKKILIHGLTFKQNTDDIRESPFLFLLKDLVKENKDVKVFDPKLNNMTLRIEFPDIVKYVEEDEKSLLKWADVVVVNSPDIEKIMNEVAEGTLILNCINNLNYDKKSVVNLF